MTTMGSKELTFSIIGAFISTLVASFFSLSILTEEGLPMILASTGASAMLMFGMPHATVSQPWNLIGGHLISAAVGVSCYLYIDSELLASSLAIPLAMLFMHWCRCIHPPGGATAITAVIGGANVHALGYGFLVLPVFLNSIILLSFAMAIGTFRDRNPFETR